MILNVASLKVQLMSNLIICTVRYILVLHVISAFKLHIIF